MSRTAQNVAVLGSTGSIGASALDVIARHPSRFKVFALSAHRRVEELAVQCEAHEPVYAVVSSDRDAETLRGRLRRAGRATEVLAGRAGLERVARHEDAHTVLTGIVGAAGLLPTIAAVDAGKRVLLANKEPLVMMGAEIVARARASRATLIPLDSEHNAILQCMPGGYRIAGDGAAPRVRRIVLTASGGPFRASSLKAMREVTPKQAVAHPNWSMGPKISVDSATLMNKGLELIEACALFSVRPCEVRVVIHPQSTVHSMVEYVDGSVIAQLGAADMRVPIACGLVWPERIESGAEPLDFFTLPPLGFEAPDETRFPCLRLAREAARNGGFAPTVLNAANEVAVAAFLDGRLAFHRVPEVIERALESTPAPAPRSLDAVLTVDALSRRNAGEIVGRL